MNQFKIKRRAAILLLNYSPSHKGTVFLYFPHSDVRARVIAVLFGRLGEDDLCVIPVGDPVQGIADNFDDITAVRLLGRLDQSGLQVLTIH